MFKKFIYIPLFLLFISLFYSPVKLFSNEILPLKIPSNPVAVGQLFYISFLIPLDSDLVDDLVIDFPTRSDHILYYQGPSVKIVDVENQIYKISIRYKAKKVGRYMLGGFGVSIGNNNYNVTKELLQIGLWSNGKIIVPHSVSWKVYKTDIFQGESFTVSIECKNCLESEIEDFKIILPNIDSVSFYEFKTSVDLKSYKIGPKTLYTITLLTYLVTIDTSGEVYLPKVPILFDTGIKSFTSPYYLKILSTNGISDKHKAVGVDFNFRYNIDKQEIAIGDNVAITVSLTGVGNLNKDLLPSPSVLGVELVRSNFNNSFQPSKRGFVGYQSVKHQFKPEKAGNYTIYIPNFRWFDIKNRQFRVEKSKKFNIKVLPVSILRLDENDKSIFLPEGISSCRQGKKYLYLQSENFFLLIPASIMFLFGLFFLIKRKIKQKSIAALILFSLFFFMSSSLYDDKVDRGLLAFETEENDNAYKIFSSLADSSRSNSAVCFNASLSSYLLGKKGEAVYYASKAIYKNPINKKYRKYLEAIEKEYELSYQMTIVPKLNPDPFYLLFLLFANFFSLLFLIYSLKKSNALLILLSFVSIGFGVFSIVFLSIILTRIDLPSVVIGQNQSLMKIPKENSAPIFSVPQGTTVKIGGIYEDYYIVNTSLGFDGWIRKEYLRQIK